MQHDVISSDRLGRVLQSVFPMGFDVDLRQAKESSSRASQDPSEILCNET